MVDSKLASAAQQATNLPSGFKAFSPFPFGGMNTQTSPVAMQDSEFLWAENFVKLGDGNLRTLWDVGDALYTVPANLTIVRFFFYTIGTNRYVAVFLSDGSAVQVDMFGNETEIGPTGTFYNAANGALPATQQWGSIYLLICNNNTPNDYWAWDGELLYTAGTVAPNGVVIEGAGLNYSVVPTVTAVGGEGSGVVLTAVIQGGSVVNVVIDDPGRGYQAGDTVQAIFTGGDTDNGATLRAIVSAQTVVAANITNAGSGYTSATAAFSGGGGSGATGTPQIGGQVQSVAITSGGSGYTSAPGVTFTGGGGSGAAGSATVGGGMVTGVVMTNGGSGYTSAPTVAFSGVGTGATGTAILNGPNGEIVGMTITAGGSGYTSPPTITISGSGTGATATAVLGPGGRVTAIDVVNGGSGYTTVPLLDIVGGGGTGATAVAILEGTSVAAVNITAPGTGYTSAPSVTYAVGSGGGGFGLTMTCTTDGDVLTSITVTNAGAGYTSPPTIVFSGGGGTGAAATAVLTGTFIAQVEIQNSGSGYTSAPAVLVEPGANNAAYATINLMPFGISGTTIETFQSRVWIADNAPQPFATQPTGGNFAVSAPESIWDFATSDGGDLFTSTDGFLRLRYVGLRQSNGYLYAFGDGSISVISGVTTSGTPATTTFAYQTVDPQTGLSFRDTLQDFSRTIVFGNETGVYGLYGGAATKISPKLDQLFTNALFPTQPGIPPVAQPVTPLTPSSASATIFNVKHYLMLMTVQDPDTQAYRNVMVTWNEKDWTITSQSSALTFIGIQNIATFLKAWGTDGKTLRPLFQTPSASLIKRLDTKIYGTDSLFIIKEMLGVWLQAQDKSANGAGINGTLTLTTSGVALQNPNFPSVENFTGTSTFTRQPNFGALEPYWPLWGASPGAVKFVSGGMRLQTQSPDFVLANWIMGYKLDTAFYGSGG